MTALVGAQPEASRTALLRRRVKIIVAVTIGYNVIEGIIALIAGAAADQAFEHELRVGRVPLC